MTEPTYRDQVRAALAQTDSSWGEATGDGDASPDYIDTLTESVVYLRDDELAKTKHALVFQRGTIIDRTRERDEARAERGVYLDSAVAYAAQVAELKAELAGLRERAVLLPEDAATQLADAASWTIWRDALPAARDAFAHLIESWRAAPSGWPCKCGTDETDMVHTAERCYSATEPVAGPVSTSVPVSLERDPDVPSSVEAPEPAAPAEATWFLAVCHQCTPILPQPFSSESERNTWANAHSQGTGHHVINEERPK